MQIGKELYEAFFKSYTSKQWDKDPKKLPSSIFNRLPLRFNYNEDYFHSSRFQGIPLNGYTALFDNLINNKLINYELGKSFNIDDDIKVKYLVIYTGPIDKLLNYKIGRLDWRSLKFKKEIKNVEDFQGTSLINYPEKKFKFTRIYEPKHLHPERKYELNKTLIIKEFPNFNNDEPYYPINDNLNRKLHRKYKMLVTKIKKYNIITGGRLGDYSYYDMDMTISAALKKFNNIEKSLK